MRQAFLLLRSDQARGPLERRLAGVGFETKVRLLLDDPQRDPSAPGSGEAAKCVSARAVWVTERLESAIAWIERCAGEAGGPGALHHAVGLIELHDPEAGGWPDIHVLNTKNTCFTSLAPLLMMAFPEIQWTFWCSWDLPPEVAANPSLWPLWSQIVQIDSLDGLDEVIRWNRAGLSSLFDPAGANAYLRRSIRDEPESTAPYLPVREATAAAIDEERDYAFFDAYVAWRSGFRAWAIPSWALTQRIMGLKAPQARFDLALEDLYLNFPDRPAECRLSVPSVRTEALPRLADCPRRVLVTVGPHKTGSPWRTFPHVFKPLSGVFDLWRRVRRLARLSGVEALKSFHWPPQRREPTAEEPRGHSSPGPLFLVARSLIARGRRLLGESHSVEESVRAAALAVHAKEFLGCRTPTTALEALALQHQAEVTAESLFLGVDENIELGDRFREIARDVKAISQWFHPKTRRRSELNARLAIIERLAKRFADLHQIEEELACLAEARRLRFKFWTHQKPWRRGLSPVLGYLSFCLSSLPRFALIVLGWAMFFGLSYYVFALITPGRQPDFWNAMAGASKAFFTGGPATTWTQLGSGASRSLETVWDFWLTFQGIVSFTNLGLLVSHLYLIVSRR